MIDKIELDASRERHEEAMEIIGTRLERGENTVRDMQDAGITMPRLQSMEESGHLTLEESGRLSFTSKGERQFKSLIRRHRLAERMLHDVLNISEAEGLEDIVCKMEHILSDDFTESICTLLGHPATCPHGRPIPPGRCCEQREHRVKPLISRVGDLKPGDRGVISFISTTDHEKMDRLAGMGLIPGVKIKVHQLHPAVVILFDETTLSMDREYADAIYVRRIK